jgi:sugar phosphate isomerase/epimerase
MRPKFSFTVSTPDTKAKALAWTGDSEFIFTRLQSLGYDGVELFVRNPRELDPEIYKRLLSRTGLVVAAIGTGQILAEDKLYFTHEDANIRKESIARVKDVVDFASELNCQVNIGKIRGNIGAASEKKEFMEDAFRELESYACGKGVLITLEPQHRFGLDNLNSTQDSINWIRDMNLPNLKIMLDVFHMQIEDPSISAGFIEAADILFHVHFADTNRGAPGTGGIDFAQILRVLKALKYSRFISMEYNQLPDSETAARYGIEYIRTMVDAIWR